MKIENNFTAHMIVKNEEKWIWFAIMSVIEYMDKILIFDTGSSDNTVLIIEDIINYHPLGSKIFFVKKGRVNKYEFKLLRQEQIELTETKWFLVLDGDEIWYKELISNLIDISKMQDCKMIATRFHNCVGDVFHYKDFSSENYCIKGIVGSITIRAYSKEIEGIHCSGDYGVEGYFDKNFQEVQKREKEIYIQDGFYFHTSYLQRSSSLFNDWKIPYRRKKVFAKLTNSISKDFKFPEVFYLEKPIGIPDPFKKISFQFLFLQAIFELMRVFKKIFKIRII